MDGDTGMLLRLADRLSDPLNIESVVRLLDVKISEAMMTYHDNSINVTTLVEQNCGHAPSKTRQRRQMRPDDSTQSIPSSSYSSSASPSSSSPSSSSALSSSSSVSASSTLSPSSSASFSSSSSPSSSESSQRPTTRDRSEQRQQQRKEQRQRQRQPHDEQRREEQPGQHDGQEEQRHRPTELQEEEPRTQHQEQQQREEQPIETRQQKELLLLSRQPLLHQEQESDQYTEQPQVTERQQHRQRLLSQPRESDQYIEQPPEERQAPRQRLQQRQPADSQQNRNQQREPGQPKQRLQSQQPRQQQRQQRPGSTEQSLTELEQYLRDIRLKLEPLRNFWIELPVAMCGDVIAEPSNVMTCWNGSHLSRQDGVTPEYTRRRPVELTITIRQQILKLKVAADKLNQAYNGWTENDLDGSGNGLDFGSGTELETAPPPIDEIRTNAPKVASSRDSSGAKTLVRLASGSCRDNSKPTFVTMLLSLCLVSFCFFYTLCR